MPPPEPSWLSLLPALVTIALAFLTRQVVASLFAGVLTGSVVLAVQTGNLADANPITSFLLPAIGRPGYAQILLIYLWSLGGLIGLWERTGGAQHFANVVGGAIARGRRSSLVFSWLLGCVFHQGGTVSTVLTGSTAKPVTDRHQVSHEELSYVVDSTAAPVATVLAFNAWPLYVAGLVAGTVPPLPDEAAAANFFWASIPFNYYGVLAVLGTLGVALGWIPVYGRGMQRARTRALEEGLLDAPTAEPMIPASVGKTTVASGYTPSLADFLVPLSVLLGLAILPYVLIGENWINEAFLCSLLSAMVLASVRGMRLKEILDAFVSGCSKMTIGAIVLGLAVTLGQVSKDLATASFVVQAVGDQLSLPVLPAALMLLCMGIAFATGTSWGTYAVVFPIAMPLAWAIHPDPTFLKVCFGAVLGGAVFGDQCSPISDTTILSSMFTGCDLMDHVRTQLPLALGVATLAALLSTFAVLLI